MSLKHNPLCQCQSCLGNHSSLAVDSACTGKPKAGVYPDTFSFGSVVAGAASVSQVAVLKNEGNADLLLKDVVITGPFTYSIDMAEWGVLFPGSQANITITFKPVDNGVVSGSIYLDTNSIGGKEFILLTGEGIGSGSNMDGYSAWPYNDGSALGGEQDIVVPDLTSNIPFAYLNGLFQFAGYSYTFDPATHTVHLASPLEPGDTLILMLSGDFNDNTILLDSAAGRVAREALRRTYAEAGYNLVDGSFDAGGTVNTATDVLLNEVGGKAYSWGGALPKIVPSGSTPLTSGGISPSAWTDSSYLASFLTAEMFGAKGGDPTHDDAIGINTLIAMAIATQIPARLSAKEYYALTPISHTIDSLGFELTGPGMEQCKIIRGDYSGPCVTIFRKNGLKISGITVDNRWHAGNDNPGVAWNFAHLQNAELGWLRGENCATYAGWVISGDATITNNNVDLHDCVASNTGGSGWQIQGARKSGHTRNKAINCGGDSSETGTGINFKVPVEDCWHLECYAENVVGMGCSVGSSFPGVYGKRLTFRGFRSQNIGIGMRLGEVEDSNADDMYFDLNGANTDPLIGSIGHGVWLVDGARRNKISARVNKVANYRGTVTIGACVGNTVILDGVTNPVSGSTLASFAAGSSGNEVMVRKGYTAPTVLRSDSGTGNVLEFEGQPYAQGQTFISSGNLALHHAKVVSVLMDTEASAPADDLVTITPGAAGQTITLTTNINTRVVTVKHGDTLINGIRLAGGVDFVMDSTRKIIQLAWNNRSSQWVEIGRMAT